MGGDHDGGEFVRFEQKRLYECFLHQFTFNDQLQPIPALVGLFDNDSQLGDKLRLRSPPARSPIIRPDRCRRANQLSPDRSPNGSLGQCTHQLHHPQRKRFRPFFQLHLVHFIRPQMNCPQIQNQKSKIQTSMRSMYRPISVYMHVCTNPAGRLRLQYTV